MSYLLSLYAFTAFSYAANFTYDGVNRRDPLTGLEQNTIEASGQILCIDAKTGEQKVSSGFFLDIGQESETTLLLSSGHSFRDASDNSAYNDCRFKPYGSDRLIPLDNNVTGELVQQNPAVYIKNDWGVSILPASTGASVTSIPVSNRSYEELHNVLQAGLGEIKFYGGNLAPDQGNPRIQISDNCSIWQPVPGAILGSGHSLYTNCDSTGSSSGGPLVLELSDGSVEAIGIMFGAIHTVEIVKQLLGENTTIMNISAIEHAIDLIPSPNTIINIAVPLIPGMREQGLSELFDDFMGK